MSERKPHRWAEAIKAWADGKVVQCRDTDLDQGKWCDNGLELPCFNEPYLEWRVKPEALMRYRVALFKDSQNQYFPEVTRDEGQARIWQSAADGFLYWLTDWIEVDDSKPEVRE